jgi:signal transduction histidine kinase/HAMP domain-containing protein
MANGVIHFFVILISVILVIRLSRSITRPIQSLTAGVEAFGEGNLAPAIGVTSKDEFGRLAKCFDELSHEIQRMISEGKRQADLALMVCSTLDTDEIARRLLNVVRQFLGGRQIALTMESVDGNGWVCFVSNEFDHVEKRQVDQLESGQLQADAPSLISIPLIAQEKVIGSLDIREHGAGADVERQINLVGSMLVSVSMALRNAQFFTELVHEKERVARQAEQLAAANTELEQTQRFKSRFLANMSHRLRTPLNSVIGCADLMESEVLGDLSDRQQQAVHSIRRSGHQLLGAIDHILNYSRLEGGELDMRWTEGHVGKVVEEALDRIRPLLTSSDKRFEPKVAIAPGAETWATDHVKLRYVLGCLLENAARSKEDAEVRVEIDKVDRGGEGWLRIAVIDNGRGIPNDRLRTIFEPFEGSEKELGSGLGLTLAKRLVDLLGGTIDVESQVGSGSTFTVVVPQHPA